MESITENENKIQILNNWIEAQEERLKTLQKPASVISVQKTLLDCQVRRHMAPVHTAWPCGSVAASAPRTRVSGYTSEGLLQIPRYFLCKGKVFTNSLPWVLQNCTLLFFFHDRQKMVFSIIIVPKSWMFLLKENVQRTFWFDVFQFVCVCVCVIFINLLNIYRITLKASIIFSVSFCFFRRKWFFFYLLCNVFYRTTWPWEPLSKSHLSLWLLAVPFVLLCCHLPGHLVSETPSPKYRLIFLSTARILSLHTENTLAVPVAIAGTGDAASAAAAWGHDTTPCWGWRSAHTHFYWEGSRTILGMLGEQQCSLGEVLQVVLSCFWGATSHFHLEFLQPPQIQ